MNKGQYYRLLVATTANPTKVIAAAKDMSLHMSAQTEESSTKDTTGNALEYEVVGLSYEISGSALVLSANDPAANNLSDIESLISDTTVYWRICLMSGDENRTVSEEICSGTGKFTNLQINAQNRQNATYQYTLTGVGAIELPDDE